VRGSVDPADSKGTGTHSNKKHKRTNSRRGLLGRHPDFEHHC